MYRERIVLSMATDVDDGPRIAAGGEHRVHWVEKGTLIAWKSTKRGLSIPAAQILGPGRVVSGLSEVVDSIGDPEFAWSFLTQEWPFDDMAATPLELLNAGRIQEVMDAAPGFGATFS